MRKIVRLCLFLLSLFTLVACKKTPLLEASETMVGTWVHFSEATDAERIIINPDGTGKIEWYNSKGLRKSTKSKAWYLENNRLSLGKATFNVKAYDIEEYPKAAWQEIIQFHDTIPVGVRYVILNGNYYAEEE